MSNYTVLHCHTMLSNGVTNIDSVNHYDDYINKAKELGMKALAFSEHGSVFSWKNKKDHIEKAGMKYIHAQEFYMTKTLEERIKDNYHVLLIAKNEDGFRELNKLSSVAFNRKDNHFYFVPRISADELFSTSDNIIISSACIGSALYKSQGEFKERYINFLRNNKHRCYLEIQHHNDEKQIEYNKFLYELHKATRIPMVACTDTHALDETSLEGRKILQKSKKIHFDEEDSWDLVFRSYDELIEAYKKQNALPMDIVIQALENTNIIADSVEEFKYSTEYKYPHLWDNPMETFREKIEAGIIERGIDKYPNYQEYLDRIEYEIDAYVHNGAVDFMLLMEDVINFCKSVGIQTGYGRGSVNGSVIAWILGITEMDSIKHDLNFERFMNVERVSLADIDTDIPPSRIDEVKQYVFDRHGLYCSDIITFNTIADKGAIRDVCRALYKADLDNMPEDIKKLDEQYNKIANAYNGQGQSYPMPKKLKEFYEGHVKKSNEVCELFDKSPDLARETYPDVFRYVDIVKGTITSVGNHPCGMICSPFSLDDSIGLCTTSSDEFPISQIYMKEVDAMNYVKLDLLKLDTIELITNTCKLAGIPMLTPDNMDINDVDVWNSMRDDTTSIFQWEGSTGQDYIKKLMSDDTINKFKAINENVDRMTLLSIGNSAIRPAGASYREDLGAGVIRRTGSKPIDEFLNSTFGYLVFQCQIIEFLHRYCGFTMGEADIVRRGFAKKTGTDQFIPIIKNGGYLTDKSEHYIDGFIATMKKEYGISEKKSEEDIVAFIQVIEDASSYLFSLNHSQPYSYEGYASGWLRYHYPGEFLTSALNINQGNEDKTRNLTAYAKKVGITVRSPKFGHGQQEYSYDKDNNVIYKGMGSIKGLGKDVSEKLYNYRDKRFGDFVDFLAAISGDISISNKPNNPIVILTKLDFFECFGEPNYLLKIIDLFTELHKKKSLSKDKVERLGISIGILEKNCQKITEKTFSGFDSIQLIKDILKEIEVKPMSLSEKVKTQIEYLGYIDMVIPEMESRVIAINNLDTTYSPKFSAYCLKTGQTVNMKSYKKKDPRKKESITGFNEIPFENGDILYMKRCIQKENQKKTDTGWVGTGDMTWWLAEYNKIGEI